MKKKLIFVLGVLGLLCWTTSATAWWQWYYHDLPYVPAQGTGGPGMWFYNYVPSGSTPGVVAPGMWFYQTLPYGPTQFWSIPATSFGVYVEQQQLPMGYGFRIRSGDPASQGIDVAIEGGALVIRSRNTVHSGMGAAGSFQSGWSTQWVALPADANLAGMTLSRKGGVLEIFIPRG